MLRGVTPASQREKLLFLVELWREPATGGASAPWRGIVKHVAHDDERYIARLSDVTAFIERCLDAHGSADDNRPESDSIRTPHW
jgi:hypothetical protein